MMTGVIVRRYAEKLLRGRDWILIYGRRKTGKTFLARNFSNFDYYMFVKRDLSIILETRDGEIEELDPKGAIAILRSALRDGKTIVLDEFQRLPDWFLDEIHYLHPRGRLLILGSSFRVIDRIYRERPPIMGLFREMKLGLFRPTEILPFLAERFDPEMALELAPFFSDPWLIRFLEDGGSSSEIIARALIMSKETIPALVGEIFEEEERSKSEIYDAIIRSIGKGNRRIRDIASDVGGRFGIDSARLMPYLKNLMKMGIVSRIPAGRFHLYYLDSPIMELFYYADSKLNISERDVSEVELERFVEERIPIYLEIFCGKLLAEVFGSRFSKLIDNRGEIDVVLEEAKIACEIKWRERVDPGDIERFLDISEGFERRILVARREPEFRGDLELLLPDDLVRMANEFRKARDP